MAKVARTAPASALYMVPLRDTFFFIALLLPFIALLLRAWWMKLVSA
jgi:hypothetical protein